MLFSIYGRLGAREKKTEIAWEIFRGYRSAESLAELLTVIGEDLRESVISGEAEAILEDPQLSYSDADFLIEVGRINDAESYILSRAGELDGDFYNSLVPLAESMEADGRPLAVRSFTGPCSIRSWDEVPPRPTPVACVISRSSTRQPLP